MHWCIRYFLYDNALYRSTFYLFTYLRMSSVSYHPIGIYRLMNTIVSYFSITRNYDNFGPISINFGNTYKADRDLRGKTNVYPHPTHNCEKFHSPTLTIVQLFPHPHSFHTIISLSRTHLSQPIYFSTISRNLFFYL